MNVLPKFKNQTTEQIKVEIAKKQLPFAVLVTQLQYNINIGAILRTANFFGAREYFYYSPNTHKWNRRTAVGTYNYTDITHINSINKIRELPYHRVAIEIHSNFNPEPLETFKWPENTLMIFGEESNGIPEEILEICNDYVYISPLGCTRSLNVGVCAGICMQDFVRKFKS